jgi:hypothetical protein
MKKTIIAVYLMGLCAVAFPQDDTPVTLQNLQGIWLYLETPENPNTNNTSCVVINNGFKSLGFEYELETKKDYINEGYVGFQDSSDSEKQLINVKELRISGMYYTELSSTNQGGFAKVPDFSTPTIVELTENILWINYGKISTYKKIDKLPSLTLKLLYIRGTKDKHNYIKEYLNIDVKEVAASKSMLYSEPEKPTKMYLIKGDIITVLEEKEGWIKIEYEGKKLITGWVKKEDVKE